MKSKYKQAYRDQAISAIELFVSEFHLKVAE